ncbi:phospholipase B [Cryptococcus wingfieldii CBS 7118]|uniref:Lysophospholipase n=1 Tax=Cryptococcus wingfieldii CBS 7118 TaxID=1295528 RepID=A0A1E3IU35_9TREE|nr:phospholipase B [Cryptococcus wingfieldii CBS 7118]ODN92068.1 phospholipase B [Cryptococcus wingfieldii CBS 7118]
MTSLSSAVSLAALVSLVTTEVLATPFTTPHAQLLAERGLGDKSYTPYEVSCPTTWTWEGLATVEKQYINERHKLVGPAVEKMMAARGLENPPRIPNIGVALSGGGYRAMLVGLGGVMGLMNQSQEASESGTGGWLEAVTYWSGLSGGSWATGSFMANGGPLPSSLIDSLWDLSSNLIYPSENKVSFYSELYTEVTAKQDEHFPVQVTDLWGLALGSHLLPEDYQLDNSPNFTISSLPQMIPAIANASLPMPIIIAAQREQGELVIAENATVYEFTPYEFGSWAFGSNYKSAGAFTSVEYLGTSLDNGAANGTCWKGFDQLSFVMGTSATLFNSAWLALNQSDTGLVGDLLQSILEDLGDSQVDVSRILNPFANYNTGENPVSSFEYITLIDAGETNQNIPFEPLIAPSRNVDAIIAFDASFDTNTTWPNGTAPRTTFERAMVLAQYQDVEVSMPEVPSQNGFINGGYNSRPTLFGCNRTDTPIVVYVPSFPWSYGANTSTYQMSYDNDEALEVMLSGMRSLTLNGSVETWPTCLACALTDRAFAYTSSNRSSTCQTCFDTWCWDGTDDTSEPEEYAPNIGGVPPWLTEKGLSIGVQDAPSSDTSRNSSSESGGFRVAGSVPWAMSMALAAAGVAALALDL